MRQPPLALPLAALAGGLALGLIGPAAPEAGAADCGRTGLGLLPLNELAPDRYLGFPGGLYPGGLNVPPEAHGALAMGRASEVQARAADGALGAGGRIVLLSLGIGFASQEYGAFQALAEGDPQINPAVRLVDGAAAGGFTDQVTDPASAYWAEVDRRLAAADVSPAQVQVLWLKVVQGNPTGPFPEHAEALEDRLAAMLAVAQARFPNLQLAYLASRAYGGYAQAGRLNPARLSPEPYAYESAFAVRWLIERQIAGEAALNPDPARGPLRAPALLWGPYLWADGLKARADGLAWHCSDFEADGISPSAGGRQKVANLLMAFFKTHPSAVPWFLADPAATPLPSATALPTGTPVPSATPGGPGPRPTRQRPTLQPTGGPSPTDGPSPTAGPSPTPAPSATPVPPTSLRVRELPSGDEMWVSTANAQVLAQLRAIDPGRPTWVCGRVQVGRQLEWGFRFAPASVTVVADPPDPLRTTIRAIAAAPGGGAGSLAIRCIQVGAITEELPGPPPTPTPGTATPPTATPSAGAPTPGGPSPRPTRTAPATPPGVPTAVRSATPAPRTWLYLPLLVKPRASRPLAGGGR